MDKLKLFGRRIKELRKAKGLTQEQLAEILGIYQKQIGNIETGQFFTTMPKLEKIATALDVKIMDLFDFEHQKTIPELQTELWEFINKADENKIRLFYKILKGFV